MSGFLMDRRGIEFGGGSICWKLLPDGAHCVHGAYHAGACPPIVDREAYDRVCKMLGWDEATGRFVEEARTP